MRQLFIFLLGLASINLPAQTKKIAFKSHSSSEENFRIALKNNLFDMDESNFGLPSPKKVFTVSLDSVIFISDSITILVTSNYSAQTSLTKEKPKLVRSGRDTVYNSPLFSNKHALDSIKTILKTEKTYQNPVEKIIFIGFDSKKSKKVKRNELVLVAVTGNSNDRYTDKGNYNIAADNHYSAFDTTVVWMLGTVLVFSLLAGLAAWKYAQSRQRAAILSDR